VRTPQRKNEEVDFSHYLRKGALTSIHIRIHIQKNGWAFLFLEENPYFYLVLKHIHMSNILLVQIEFIIPDEIHSTLNLLKISPEVQEEALSDAIFTFVQERFLVEEEEEIINHVVNWEA
jgi:hypothetical protein